MTTEQLKRDPDLLQRLRKFANLVQLHDACKTKGRRIEMLTSAADYIEQLEGQLSAQTAEDMPVAVWYRTERDITEEYFTNYSEGPDRPDGEGWKPLCDPQTVMAMVMAEQFKRAVAGPQSGVSSPKTIGQSNEQNAVIQTEQPSLSDEQAWKIYLKAQESVPFEYSSGKEFAIAWTKAILAQRQDSDKEKS